MPTIETKLIDAAARRAAVRNAEADEIGRILSDALATNDPVKLSKLKVELKSIDPSASLEALTVIAEFVADTKPADFEKAAKALAAAEKAVASKEAEKAKAIAKLDADIASLADQRDIARSANALADVSRKRFEAMKTGTPEPGFGPYAQPAIIAWARRAKLV